MRKISRRKACYGFALFGFVQLRFCGNLGHQIKLSNIRLKPKSKAANSLAEQVQRPHLQMLNPALGAACVHLLQDIFQKFFSQNFQT